MRILHENPELYGAKRRFLPFLCIAERVTVRGAALFSRAVNSNDSNTGITRNEEEWGEPELSGKTAGKHTSLCAIGASELRIYKAFSVC